MPARQTVRPLQASLRLAACVLALSVAFAAGARAQDDDDGDDGGDDGPAPLVVDINGPCVLTLKGQSIPCKGVAYMVFPANHRIDFTAITDMDGWAFSGDHDNDRDGRYALALDSVLDPGSERLDANGRCEMRVAEDRRSVTSLECRASTQDGEVTLKASGTIEVEDPEDDDEDDGPDDDTVIA
jgi:hypothetical protein